MWVYVGNDAPAGATPVSYEADNQPHRMTLTDQCSTLLLNGDEDQSGMICDKGQWTHVIVSYTPGQVTVYKNGVQARQFNRNAQVPAGGVLVLGQDNDNAKFPREKALAPGQVGVPQLFNRAIAPAEAGAVKSGSVRGNILDNFNGYKIQGMVNFDHNHRQRA